MIVTPVTILVTPVTILVTPVTILVTPVTILVTGHALTNVQCCLSPYCDVTGNVTPPTH